LPLQIAKTPRYNAIMSQFDPRQHHRRSIRLPDWDYRTPAVYFVTICAYERQCLFENPAWATIATAAWMAIPTHVARVVLDEWVLMPNHLHGLLVLTDDPAGGAPITPFDMWWAGPPEAAESPRFANAPSGSLGSIIRSYKAAVTRRMNRRCGTPRQKRWQRGYYERIVRDHRELERIRLYIRENPARWAADHDNLDALLRHMTYHTA
jgi:REP element-mobilizing transposase RayT